jgi:uncharacterized protein (DUF58 family)
LSTREERPLAGARIDLAQLLALRFETLAESRLPGRVTSKQGGARLSRYRGRGLDFAEVRAYAPGDDVRTIDWKVTARKGRVHTKVFREERERVCMIFVDQTQSMFFGSRLRLKSVAAAEVAARLAWRALAEQDRVGGVVVGNDSLAVHPPYRVAKTLARYLGDVSRYNQRLARGAQHPGSAHIAAAIDRLCRLARRDQRIYLISDFQTLSSSAPDSGPGWTTDHWRRGLRTLARHNEVIAIRVCDALEAELPPADLYRITDGAARWQFDAGDPRLRQRYRDNANNHADAFARSCSDAGVRMAVLTTDASIGATLASL